LSVIAIVQELIIGKLKDLNFIGKPVSSMVEMMWD